MLTADQIEEFVFNVLEESNGVYTWICPECSFKKRDFRYEPLKARAIQHLRMVHGFGGLDD